MGFSFYTPKESAKQSWSWSVTAIDSKGVVESSIGRGLVFPSMQVDSVQLSRKNLVDNPDYKMDYKITAEYEPCVETGAEQGPFTLRKSIHGSKSSSRNNSSMRKLNFHTDDDLNDEDNSHNDVNDKSFGIIDTITPEMEAFISKWADNILGQMDR